MQKILYTALILAGVGTSFTLAAEDISLAETVVTATRTETAVEQLATATTVFTRDDIERLQVRTLPDLLKTASGLDLTQNGGYGQQANVYMRGTNSDHMLVLVDGIKAGSVTLGATAFSLLPIDQIERVEIARGPQSSVYGSEAMGGVIQIFTRKGAQQEKPSVSLDVGGGSFDTVNGSGAVSGKLGTSWYSLGASHLNSQGINVRHGEETDRDGHFNTGLSARIGHHFDNNTELEASFMRAEGKTVFDGTPNSIEFVNQVVATSASFDVMDNWRSMLRFGQTQDLNDNFNPNGTFFSRINSTRWNASWLQEFRFAEDHRFTFGSDYRVDEVQSSVAYSESSRYDVGVFGDLHSRVFDNHFLNASLRWDENQATGNNVTGNLGWRFNWLHGLSAFASFGNAFKAPSFNDLYWPLEQSTFFGTTYITEGNRNLRPEESTSVEVGVGGEHEWWQWQLRAYHTNIDNLIDWSGVIVNPTTYRYQPQNVAKAQIDGIEAETSLDTWGWQHKINANMLDPQNRQTNMQLARRAGKTLSYDLSKTWGNWDIGGHVLAQDRRFDDRENRIEVAGYVTLDLRTAYHIDKHWMLSAKLNNLLDKQYQTIDTFYTAGRNFFFSIHYNN